MFLINMYKVNSWYLMNEAVEVMNVGTISGNDGIHFTRVSRHTCITLIWN